MCRIYILKLLKLKTIALGVVVVVVVEVVVVVIVVEFNFHKSNNTIIYNIPNNYLIKCV